MAGFRTTQCKRVFTVEIEVSNLADEVNNMLDTQLRVLINHLELIESLLSRRAQGEAAIVVTDEKNRTECADLELF